MTTILDCSHLSWQVRGWRPFVWQMGQSMETGSQFCPDIPAIPARVPGSAQRALADAKQLPDWNVGRDSLLCEWVEHRQWEFLTSIPAGTAAPGSRVELHADGLDHAGWILVDGLIVGTFTGSLLRHRFDLSGALADGKAHRLSVLFAEPPAEQGQVGFTSKSEHLKPRYNYSWDWCPRLVPVGISDSLRLVIDPPAAEVVKVAPSLAEDLRTARVRAWITSSGAGEIELRLGRDGATVAVHRQRVAAGTTVVALDGATVEPWWPNGEGAQPLYTLSTTWTPADGSAQTIDVRTVGFKRIAWKPCTGAPAGALPWVCEVNGRPIFLQGANWVPLALDYHSVPEADYARTLGLYREMGANVLRVWGGGFLEREAFYRLCDELGIFVWQEFPLSSSGPDNWPPEDARFIERITPIARDYIRRRCHHANKLLWCGGNELQSEAGKKTGCGVPVDLTHPCIAALAQVVAEEDPETRFLPASSSGPSFMASEADFGKGLHHDVHGPWNHEGPFADWERYWKADDALFRSETGMPGASSVAVLERYRGTCAVWPATRENPYWLHSSSWWIQWALFQDRVAGLEPAAGLAEYVRLSQDLQARALAVAVGACKARFPACGGFIIWMGHDAFPCATNTSVIDFDRGTKPAYHALRTVFRRRPGAAAAG